MQIGTESATVASCQWQSANVGAENRLFIIS